MASTKDHKLFPHAWIIANQEPLSPTSPYIKMHLQTEMILIFLK